MNPLLRRLASLRRKVRFLDGWLGVCALIALILGVAVTEGVLDFWMHLPSLVRAVLLVGLLVSSGYVAYRFILRPFSKPCDDLNLALRIEEKYPELNDALATTVQFLNQTKDEQARVGGSAAMRERTVQDTVEKASKCDFGRILDRRAAALSGVAACCILAAAGFVVTMNAAYSQIAFWRFVEPFGMHTWTRITVVRHAPPRQDADETWKPMEPKVTDRIAKGQLYKIKVNLDGQMPKKSEARVEILGQIKTDKTVPLKISDDKLSATFEMFIPIPQSDGPQIVRFKVLANDGAFPPRSGTWHEVKVMPPPKLTGPPHLTVHLPKYTDLKSPVVLETGTGLVKVLAGSTVVLRARAEEPLDEAWLEYLPENEKLIEAARQIIVFGQTSPLATIAAVVGSHQTWGTFPAKFDADQQGFAITFQPWVTGKYVLHLRDPFELATKLTTDLTVLVDPLPEVKLAAPRPSLTVLPDADIPFKFLVTDEEFAIKSIYIEYRAKAPGAPGYGEAGRLVLYHADDYGKLLPALLAKMGKPPFAGRPAVLNPFTGGDLRLRYQRLEVDSVWSLRSQFRDGDQVEVIVGAVDFCDVYPLREPGRSNAIELRIVSKPVLIKDIQSELIDIRGELKKIIEAEKKALATVKATRKQDKFDQKVLENFNENGQQPQSEVVERTDTLRHKLKDIREKLRNNKLTGERTYEQASMVQGVLDSIAQTELPQITPKLDDVRKEIVKGDKNTPQTMARAHKKLDEAARLQENVLKALDELLKKLNPQARIDDLIEKATQLGQKEKDLVQDLKNLNAEKKGLDANPALTRDLRAIADKNQREKIDQKRLEQLELAHQAEKLIQELKAAKKEFEKQDDQPNLDKVTEALKNAVPPDEKPKAEPMPKQKEKDKTPLNAQMKNAADQIKGNQVPEKTLKEQEDIAKRLEKLVESLEGRNEDQAKRQIEERKEVQKKIEQIAKDNEELRQEVKKAQLIEDMEERLKEKQKIAEKMGELQERIEETRRELARLNEQRPADELERAAQNLEEAKKQLQQDGNPEPQIQKAKQELERAKEEVKQAQDELARELLIKIADQLEGLKMQQVGSVERSEAFHAKIIEKKSWEESYLDTIEGNIDTQKRIGEEADSVKEKIKEAKVFHSILEKAKKSMDEACSVMENRRDEGKERRYSEKGEKMPDVELKDEGTKHDETVRHQKQAVRRLDILLDSIKEEIARIKQKKEDDAQAKNENPKNPDDPKAKDPPKRGPNDGLPPMAELKALRAEQSDLNERFEDFATKNPNFDKLDDDQKKQLQDLTAEQAAMHRLFLEITAVPEQPDPAPNEKKEGDKK
jgi:hypothetical protein